MAKYLEKPAKTILRKGKYTDPWFISKYRFNVYRGCSHACAYCDGRNERYNTTDKFGEEIEVKTNIIEVLKKEIGKIREKTIISVGGGVGDSYQPAEIKYQLTRKALLLLKDHGHPVHILTKSALIERDFDLLREMNEKNAVVVSFSFSTNDEKTAEIFEPGCSPVSERFRVLEKFKKDGFFTGIMYMPVIPFISDKPEDFRSFLNDAFNTGGDFILFGGMTLKEGRQKDHYYNILNLHYPGLSDNYDRIYIGNQYGNLSAEYYKKISGDFFSALRDFKIPSRIPHYIYKDRIELKDEVAMILFHIHHFLSIRGINRQSFETAAWNILKLGDNLVDLVNSGGIGKIRGVGPVINGIISEIVFERKCSYYEKLLFL